MQKRIFEIANARKLAEKIHAIQNINNEVSFATLFEIDESGEVLESSTDEWWGAKFIGAFDGTFLLFGTFGGGDWYVFDATFDMTTEEIQVITEEMFRQISAEKVCIEETD